MGSAMVRLLMLNCENVNNYTSRNRMRDSNVLNNLRIDSR